MHGNPTNMCDKWANSVCFRESGGETHISKVRRQVVKQTLGRSVVNRGVGRRGFLGAALGACAITPSLGFLSVQIAGSKSGSLDKRATRQHDAVAGH
jgi:hypothetical protein